MRTFVSFGIAMAVSGIVAQMLALQFAIAFGTRDEFILVIVALGAFGIVTIAALVIGFVASDATRAIDLAALVASGIAAVIGVGFVVATVVFDGVRTLSVYDIQIVIEFFVPALLLVAIQWWVVRRVRLKIHNKEQVGGR